MEHNDRNDMEHNDYNEILVRILHIGILFEFLSNIGIVHLLTSSRTLLNFKGILTYNHYQYFINVLYLSSYKLQVSHQIF